MISEEQFYRVQAILDGRNPNIVAMSRRNRNNPEFPLRRITKCSICKSGFTGAWSQGKLAKYGYYFCPKRCVKSSIPVKDLELSMKDLLKEVTPTPKCLDLFIGLLRRTYYQRLANLQKRKDQADEELKKLYELRQSLIEKNLLGIYSDEIFREQNKLIEEKVAVAQISKNDAVISKYNLEAIVSFIKEKFSDLVIAYTESKLNQKKVLLCSIFPSGMPWSYPGYSNTEISPLYQAIRHPEDHQVAFGAGDGNRTHNLFLGKEAFYH